jgi:acyl-CoA synthetase (NDP forming)
MRSAVVTRPATDVASVLEGARRAGRDVLLEPEGLALARAFGVEAPVHALVHDADEAAALDLAPFGDAGLVVKVCAADVVHKGVAGGVLMVPGEPAALREAVATLAQRFAGHDVAGFLVCARVSHEVGFGGELLLGMRWTDDFGPAGGARSGDPLAGAGLRRRRGPGPGRAGGAGGSRRDHAGRLGRPPAAGPGLRRAARPR